MLDDLGNIGDFLGGIGVVVTLAYLALQIRQNTRSVRSAALHSISTSISEHMDMIARDPAITKLWYDALSRAEHLSDADIQRFHLLILSLARRWENAFYQSRTGVLESASWSGMREGLIFIFSTPGVQRWWNGPRIMGGEGARTIFSADFVAFVDRACDVKRPQAGSAV